MKFIIKLFIAWLGILIIGSLIIGGINIFKAKQTGKIAEAIATNNVIAIDIKGGYLVGALASAFLFSV